jgi:YidC/Oxa1 family membrane protein insertase
MFASSIFEPFFKFFASVLAFFYALTSNYALAIILLTLVVMLIVTPLTLKGTRSMMMMQQLQPEMRKIQARYKDDRQKLNEELLKFYKENNINPLGGCLPLLVQMPVFLVLYQVLRGLTRRVSDLGFPAGWASGQFPLGNITKPPSIVQTFDPAWIDPSSKMYQDLSSSTTMTAFGMDLSESASKAFSQGIVHASPFLVLIAIVAVTGFVQQRQIQGRNPNAQVNPQQQMIMKIMPIFLPVISFGLPAGLVLYFAVSNMYRIGQQAFISHSIYGGRDQGMTWKDMLGLGAGPAKGSSGAKSKSTGKQKAISTTSRPAAKGRAASKATAKGGRQAQAKGAPAKGAPAKGTPAKAGTAKGATAKAAPEKGGAQKGTPQKGAAAKRPARARGTTGPAPDQTEPSAAGRNSEPSPETPDRAPSSTGGKPASGGGATLQPRARRKKR